VTHRTRYVFKKFKVLLRNGNACPRKEIWWLLFYFIFKKKPNDRNLWKNPFIVFLF
jgi:hypothetical protein